jgi:hypothetical protein
VKAVPYLLLVVLALATGLGAALGATQAPDTHPAAAVAEAPCIATQEGTLCSGTIGPAKGTLTFPSKGLVACMTKELQGVEVPIHDLAASRVFLRELNAALSTCETHTGERPH